jgi:hypothetical protein
MQTSGSQPPGGSAAWASWVAFAAILIMLTGVFAVIAGLAAVFDDGYLVSTSGSGDILLLNTTALGIAWIVIGAVKAWAGFALIQGREWARWVTIAICFFHAVVDLLVLTQQPFISTLFIAFNVLVIYAVTVRWEAAKVGMGD